MAAGLQVWNASGDLVLDTSTYTGKVLGILDITAGVDGSVTDSAFAIGDPYWQCVSIATYPTNQPTFTFNSGTNTLSWAWESRLGQDCKLIYGVY